ncbi:MULTISPECIES: hypothetical protein [Rhizobium]|uniref:hypothetical protein n=1 Tax=Rhizobium TaxID=379 RepID=UPI0013B002C4|nr:MULTISPECIES: hypothetical protein [Rhizobium]
MWQPKRYVPARRLVMVGAAFSPIIESTEEDNRDPSAIHFFNQHKGIQALFELTGIPRRDSKGPLNALQLTEKAAHLNFDPVKGKLR